jgi:cell division protein FtsL
MKKPILIITTLLIIVLSLSIIRIYISNQIVTSGVVLGRVQSEVDSYKTQNIILAEKLYSESSLTSIAEKATKDGYIAQSSDFIVSGQIPIAFKQ